MNVDTSIIKSKVFLYTDENYSHINNKIDIEDNEMFKKFKQYSRRERTFRKVEFFKEEDIQLLQELDRAKEYKRLNINFDTYKEPHNHFPLGLEGVILCVGKFTKNHRF